MEWHHITSLTKMKQQENEKQKKKEEEEKKEKEEKDGEAKPMPSAGSCRNYTSGFSARRGNHQCHSLHSDAPRTVMCTL